MLEMTGREGGPCRSISVPVNATSARLKNSASLAGTQEQACAGVVRTTTPVTADNAAAAESTKTLIMHTTTLSLPLGRNVEVTGSLGSRSGPAARRARRRALDGVRAEFGNPCIVTLALSRVMLDRAT